MKVRVRATVHRKGNTSLIQKVIELPFAPYPGLRLGSIVAGHGLRDQEIESVCWDIDQECFIADLQDDTDTEIIDDRNVGLVIDDDWGKDWETL